MKRKEAHNDVEKRTAVYVLAGLFSGHRLTDILDRCAARNMECPYRSMLMAMSHGATSRTFIVLFIFGKSDSRCVMFNRTTGAVNVCKLMRMHLEFELPKEGMWDDDYRRVTTNDVSTPPLKKTKYCSSSSSTLAKNQWELTSLSPTAFQPVAELDTMCNFSSKTETMVSTKTGTFLAADVSRAISIQCAKLSQSGAVHDTLYILQRRIKNDHIELDVFNLLGQTTRCVRIGISKTKEPLYEIACFQRYKRCMEELELGSSIWDAMSPAELNEFGEREFASIMSQASLTSRDPLPASSVYNLNSEQDGPRCDVWMKFIRSHLAPKTCLDLSSVTIKTLNIPSALHKFDVQVLLMKKTNTPIKPRIMFHGVRGNNVISTVDKICNYGFNPKYTQNCVYGAGGTYCSPQIACALNYTSKISNTNQQIFVFVCMVVLGTVCFGGQDQQQMAPDQHSWGHALENGHEIYCAETILPFALLTFIP